VYVNVLLWEWNRDAFVVETLLDRFLEIEENSPVITGCTPRANVEIDSAAGEFHYYDLRCGIFENPFIGVEDVENNVLDLVEVVRVANSNRHIDATRIVSSSVDDAA